MALLRYVVRSATLSFRNVFEISSAISPVSKELGTRLSSSVILKDNVSLSNEQLLLQKERKDAMVIATDVISKVNNLIVKNDYGRLFAVVHLCGKQFKVTTEDLIVLEGYWPPTVGDKLNLEKILLVGGSDFTLVGRPILPHGLVTVQSTVVEKSMSHIKTRFRKIRRKQYMRINFHRSEYTILRINDIQINGNIKTD